MSSIEEVKGPNNHGLTQQRALQPIGQVSPTNPVSNATSGNPDTAVQIPQSEPVKGSRNYLATAFDTDEEDKLIERFGAEAHFRGMQARKASAISIWSILQVGQIISEQYCVEGGDRGRASKYGAWCAAYMPWLGRKTCDRWRKIYEAFEDFLNDTSRRDELRNAWDNLQLTALYKLSEEGVSVDARDTALEWAKTNRVTRKMAEGIIADCGGQAPRNGSRTVRNDGTTSVRELLDGAIKVCVSFPPQHNRERALERVLEWLQAEIG